MFFFFKLKFLSYLFLFLLYFLIPCLFLLSIHYFLCYFIFVFLQSSLFINLTFSLFLPDSWASFPFFPLSLPLSFPPFLLLSFFTSLFPSFSPLPPFLFLSFLPPIFPSFLPSFCFPLLLLTFSISPLLSPPLLCTPHPCLL